ncbi:hypothetical protein niasHS_018104 [Heterodera schachtii]|uniref:Uncharacterized protein n=2 Tax=Heterodera TaxID=34509 RepID=A0ABD2HPB2_HETSC
MPCRHNTGTMTATTTMAMATAGPGTTKFRHSPHRTACRPRLLSVPTIMQLVPPLVVLFTAFTPTPLGQILTQSVTNFSEPFTTPEMYQQAVLGIPVEMSSRSTIGLTFNDVLKQRRVGNNMEQCPCVVLPGSHKCVNYDGRYQSALIEEAMITFVDSSMDPRIFDQRMGGQQISAHTLECRTEECRQCVGMLTFRLRQIGFLQGQPNFPFPVPTPYQLRPGACPRIRISRTIPKYYPPPSVRPSFNDVIAAGAPLRAAMEMQPKSPFGFKTRQVVQQSRQSSSQPQISLFLRDGRGERDAVTAAGVAPMPPQPAPPLAYSAQRYVPASTAPWRSRPARAGEQQQQQTETRQHGAAATARMLRQTLSRRPGAQPIIGKRFVINCVERGDSENEHTDFLNLCTTCWTWRQLPEDYFPRLINELVCQENDFCLSGWGVCNQRYRNFDVLQRVTVNGQDEWRPTTISAASCCDCKVKAGSQAHSLVVGGKS